MNPSLITEALPRARFVAVVGDHMEPTLTFRDFVAVVPVDGFMCDGLYLVQDPFGTPIVKRCQVFPGPNGEQGYLMLFSDRPGYIKTLMTRDQFADDVLGIVAATVHVSMPDMLMGAS